MAGSVWLEKVSSETSRAGWVWRLRWQEGGRGSPRRGESLGTSSRRVAEAAKREKRAELDARTSLSRAVRGRMPPDEALRLWLRDLAVGNRRPDTITSYRRKMEPLVKAWGGTPLTEWSSDMLRAELDRRKDQAPATRAGIFSACSAFHGWAVKRGIPIGPLVEGVVKPILERNRIETFTVEEVGALIEAARPWQEWRPAGAGRKRGGWHGVRRHGLRSMLTLCGRLGMRRGECLRATWEDVDERSGLISIHGKNRSRRSLPIPAGLLAVLREDPTPGNHLVRSLRAQKAMYRALGRVYDRAGIPAPSQPLHILRHSWISNLLSAGAPIHVVRDMAGHESITTTDRYAHGKAAQAKAALDLIDPE